MQKHPHNFGLKILTVNKRGQESSVSNATTINSYRGPILGEVGGSSLLQNVQTVSAGHPVKRWQG